MDEFDYKEYARQLKENAVNDDNGVIRCSPALWEQIVSIIENIPTADVVEVKHGKWIDVKDRLPELDKEVIVATESMVFCARRRRFERKHFWTNAVWNYIPIDEFTGKILFWTPLPEHPKVIGKEV